MKPVRIAVLACTWMAALQLLPSQQYAGQPLDSRLRAMEREHLQISATQTVILDQLKQVLDIRRQVFTDGERLKALEKTVQDHHTLQLNEPATLAVLQTKVDGIARVGIFLLAGMASMLSGAAVYVFKQLRSGVKITLERVAVKATEAEHHEQIVDALAEIKADAEKHANDPKVEG